MLKWIGGLMIWLGCAGWGVRAAGELGRYNRMLEDLVCALEQMEQELVLRAIVKAESLTVSEDEYQKALNDFYTKYKGQFADAAALEAYYGRERFENELLWNKVIAKVMESGIPVKATGEAATESAQ